MAEKKSVSDTKEDIEKASEDRLLSEDFDRATAILQKAKEKRSIIFLKGVIGYITKMCPEELKK